MDGKVVLFFGTLRPRQFAAEKKLLRFGFETKDNRGYLLKLLASYDGGETWF